MASEKAHRDYYRQLLAVVFEFMLLSGMRTQDVGRLATRALTDAGKIKSKKSWRRRADLMVAGLIIDAWHRNRLYVDKFANPKPIPLKGPAPSVEALIRAEGRDADPADLIRRLRSLKMLVRCGRNRYRPSGRIVVVPKLDTFMQQHITRSIWLLLKTVKRNLAVTENSHGLVERGAEIPDLPLKYVPEFRAFAKLQATALLARINDWLEARRARRTGTRRRAAIGAGVHVFAYLDDHRAR